MDAPKIPETSVPAAGAAEPTTAAPTAPASQPLAAASQPPAVVSAAPENPTPTAARPKSPVRLMLLVALAISGTGSLMLLASAMRVPEGAAVANPAPATPETATNPGTASSAAATGPAATPLAGAVAPAAAGIALQAAEPVAESAGTAPMPKWAASANPRKAGYGTGMVFELAANGDVEVWRKRVRPVLTVRCAARTTEVFVVTDSPAAIERNSNRHTITLAFDGQEAAEQQWEHSIDHDALFAPNGRALVRQIAAGKTMTFAFAPFNAPPATVTFQVAGFTAQHKAAARMCGLETTAARARGLTPKG